MSRNSDAKKARRRKRRAGRDTRWPGYVERELDALADEVAVAAKEFDSWITSRGWVLDVDSATDDVVSWVYPPSGAEVAGDAEPVTRVWTAIVGDDDDFPRGIGAALVGTGADGDGLYTVTPDRLVDRIEALESYRPGDARPVLG